MILRQSKATFEILNSRVGFVAESIAQIHVYDETMNFLNFSLKNHCFVINEYLEHKLDYKTYLESKISIGDFDRLNITSVSLLGCSFVPKQGP